MIARIFPIHKKLNIEMAENIIVIAKIMTTNEILTPWRYDILLIVLYILPT